MKVTLIIIIFYVEVVSSLSLKTKLTQNLLYVSDCNKPIEIHATSLIDPTNFSLKKNKFYIERIDGIYQYDKRNINKFEKRLLFSELSDIPFIVTGSSSCVKFQSNDDTIIVCLNSEKEAIELLRTYERFLTCAKGGIIDKTPIDVKLIKKMIEKSCLDVHIDFDGKIDEKALQLGFNNFLYSIGEREDVVHNDKNH